MFLNLIGLDYCSESLTEIDRLRGLVERLERHLNESYFSQDRRFGNVARLCQQQRAEIDGLRGFVNEMTGAVKLFERCLNKLLMRVKHAAITQDSQQLAIFF